MIWNFQSHSLISGRQAGLESNQTPTAGDVVNRIYVKVLHSICQQIWKTQQWPQDWKRSVFISIPKKDKAKECSNYCTIALVAHASNSTSVVNVQMFKLDLEKAEEPEINLPTSVGSSKKREFQKNIYFCFIEYAKIFVWITTNSGKFFKREEYQTI